MGLAGFFGDPGAVTGLVQAAYGIYAQKRAADSASRNARREDAAARRERRRARREQLVMAAQAQAAATLPRSAREDGAPNTAIVVGAAAVGLALLMLRR